MCGISGIYGLDKSSSSEMIRRMNACIAHRGPDDEGYYIDEHVALGHRRLAIIDLSPAGHQPMQDNDQELELIFNGEIYNFMDVRPLMNEYQFKTKSDSEVILAAYKKWGAECVHQFNGMFAFAIWNKPKQQLFIARDRLGIKPLYYFQKDKTLLFASEVRALLDSGLVPRKINRSALPDYFTYQTVHAPETLVEGVKMLMPGHTMLISNEGVNVQQYWSPQNNFTGEAKNKSYTDVCNDVNDLLRASVKRRLISDVPFGAFLSGGIDSSAVVGLMSEVQQQPVKTFTIVFNEEEFSEAKYARIIAKKFNTDHHEFHLKPKDFLDELPLALKALDHPSGDGPNSYIVSRITRENGITMALSGLGGDELFAGYPVFSRYLKIKDKQWLWKTPHAIRKLAGTALTAAKPGITSNKAKQLLELMNVDLANAFPLFRQVGNPETIQSLLRLQRMPADQIKRVLQTQLNGKASALPSLSQVSIAEITTYMQNVLLRDTDQMSMAVALEVRVPFLDYKLVEYVLGIPDQFKKPVSPKKLLVDSLKGLLPDEIVNRKKMGFEFPWEAWLKNELKDFCHHHIENLSKRNSVNGSLLKERWKRFLNGDKTIGYLDMWLCVVLEDWMERNRIEE